MHFTMYGVSDKVMLKLVCPTTVNSKNIEILHIAILNIILSNKQIANVLIKLCRLVYAFVVCVQQSKFFWQLRPM